MKKLLVCVVGVYALFMSVSCAMLATEPTLTGYWKTSGEYSSEYYYFTEDGIYVREYLTEYDSYYEFGNYTYDDVSVVLGYDSLPYFFDGRTLVLDGIVYKRAGRSAVNNSQKLCGVWGNDDYSLGIAKDGLIVSQGRYMNCDSWSSDGNEIVADGYSSDFVIVNDNLYIRDFDFLDAYDVIKLKRNTSAGVNQTGMSVLCSKGPWFYQNLNSASVSGVVYQFNYDGSFNASNIVDGAYGTNFSGTFTLDGNRIHLSNGDTLIFAYIDETPFGYN